MELPIQLKFFKKLELYQELSFQNKKVKKAQPLNQRAWRTEKEVLKWTTWNHHHVGVPIDTEYIKLILPTKNNHQEWNINTAIQSLIIRGFAQPSHKGIVFTQTGLLMGEVINDVEGKGYFGPWKYPLLLAVTWMTALAGAFIVMVNFLKVLNL